MHIVFEVAGEPEALMNQAERVLAIAKAGEDRNLVVEALRQIQKRVSGRVIEADCEQLETFIHEVASTEMR